MFTYYVKLARLGSVGRVKTRVTPGGAIRAWLGGRGIGILSLERTIYVRETFSLFLLSRVNVILNCTTIQVRGPVWKWKMSE